MVVGKAIYNYGHWTSTPFYYRYIWRWQANDYNEVNA